VDEVRTMCTSIAGGSDDEDLVQDVVTRFDDGTGIVDEAAAAELVEIVRDAEWCA